MRLTIKLKLALSFAAVIVLTGAMAFVGITNLAELNDTLQQLVRGPAQRLELIQAMYADILLQNRGGEEHPAGGRRAGCQPLRERGAGRGPAVAAAPDAMARHRLGRGQGEDGAVRSCLSALLGSAGTVRELASQGQPTMRASRRRPRAGRSCRRRRSSSTNWCG